ncbi:DNA repair and recombination protein rad22 [Nannizzia gypsea CBS 118893]|uniref:RAD52 homolog n=1 Tax=Arthroderma gypseum (strain ATCC MYA-4604 / CBS 118893) TaxID=535722 RepID=E5R335_ARTGP|nr:DNA repair and recombination protein rad22 [Nannizzia gypsea CBS 118893]EFQ98739.1 DNA repair and recombination protein rad22 [Nannizzia gypsea CBS 118893]
MPAIGDQHRLGPGDNPAISANPYLQGTRRVEEYTAAEVASLKERLNKQLGPEFLSSRPSGGGKVHYITADKCINLANEVFGFNGWSSSIQNITQDFADENPNTGKVSVGLSVIVRVTLKDGTYHEDIGYGHIENCKGKAAAFEKAKKEGTTDALKRTLRTFGNVLGNCIYDKEYLSKVVKVKATPVKFDVDNLHRHVDFVPPKIPTAAPTSRIVKHEYQSNGPSNLPARIPDIQSITAEDSLAYEFEGEFGSDVFDEADFAEHTSLHPDEVALEEPDYSRRPTGQNGHQSADPGNSAYTNRTAAPVNSRKPIASVSANSAVPSHVVPADGIHRNTMTAPKTPIPSRFAQDRNIDPRQPSGRQAMQPNGPPLPHSTDQGRPKLDHAANNESHKASVAQGNEEKVPEDPVVGFFSARAAEALINDPHTAAKSAPVFDPQFDSPSIRKTAGIDHTSSSPIVRKSLQALQQQAGKVPSPGARANTATSNNGGPNGPGPSGRPPMTSSYRPPIRRSMGAATTGNVNNLPNMPPPIRNNNSPGNGGHQQNEHGKRPPLVDTTNVPSNERTKNQTDTAKRTRVEDANAPKPNP